MKAHLIRKLDRREYKEQLYLKLKEQIYPDVHIRDLMNLTLEVFANLKDVDSRTLKMLIHNASRLFPEKFEYASAELVRERLDAIWKEIEERS